MSSLICDAPPAAAMHVTHELATSAWLTDATSDSSGWLMFQDGAVSFRDHASQIVFQSRLEAIERVDFPWWHWGQVCRIRLYGETFGLHFAPPFGGELAVRVQGLSCIRDAVRQLVCGGGYARPSHVAAAWRAIFQAARGVHSH